MKLIHQNIILLLGLLVINSCCDKEDSALSYDCIYNSSIESDISDDWDQLKLCAARGFLLGLTGYEEKMLVNTGPSSISIDSWTISDTDGHIVYMRENFPSNDETYGWDGLVGSDYIEGEYRSVFTFTSPTEIENRVEQKFLALLCSRLPDHIENGFPHEEVVWVNSRCNLGVLQSFDLSHGCY